MSSRAPSVDCVSRTRRRQPAQTGLPHDTRKGPLTVAFFRTWRGSRASAAWDPIINAASRRTCLEPINLGREFNPARADCGYREPPAPRLARPNMIATCIGGDNASGRFAGSPVRHPHGGRVLLGRVQVHSTIGSSSSASRMPSACRRSTLFRPSLASSTRRSSSKSARPNTVGWPCRWPWTARVIGPPSRRWAAIRPAKTERGTGLVDARDQHRLGLGRDRGHAERRSRSRGPRGSEG